MRKHSSENSFRSNLICSSTCPDAQATERGQIKHPEGDTEHGSENCAHCHMRRDQSERKNAETLEMNNKEDEI